MNLYHCMIDLANDAQALNFAQAVDDWMSHLRGRGLIGDWRLMRRKLNLASDAHRDFLLEIELDGLRQLEDLFRHACSPSDEVDRLYSRVHGMIGQVEFGLYRPYPDPERVERAAIL